MTNRSGLALLVWLSITLACGDDHSVDPAPEPGNQANDRITIINDDATLAARVVDRAQTVDVETGVGERRAINPTPIKIDLFAVDATVGSGVAYGVGKDGLIVQTLDGGLIWSTRTSGTDEDLTDVYFPTALIGFAVGKRGTVLKTGDGGHTWHAQDGGTNDDLNAVAFPVDPFTGFAVGKDGTLIRTVDGGETWSGSTIGDDMFDIVFPADALTGWAVGKDGQIRTTTDGGATWNGQSSGTNRDLYDVDFGPDALTGYAVGERGTLLMTTDGGATWEEGDSGSNTKIRGVAFPTGSSAGVWVAEDGRVATTDDSGAGWTEGTSATSRDLYDVDFTVDGSVGYAVGKDGIIMRTTDGGATWTLLAIAVSLELISEIASPEIDGSILQATSVVMKGDKAIVSYHMRGEPYLGAIEVLKIGNGENPKLKSSATFIDTDINAVSFHDGYVYAAESTGDPAYPFPAVIEVMKLDGDRLILADNQQMPLTSYAGTSVAATDSRIYATSGNGGQLTVFDQTSWTEIGAIALDDARWVDVDASGYVAVAQGTPGRLAVFNGADLSPLGVYAFPGADVPESKSTVELVGGKAIVAAGTAGCHVLSLASGLSLANVPRPDPETLGLDPAVVVTNAVSADEDLLFISNGEAGVYLAEADDKFKDTGSETEPILTVLGRLAFNELESVNHVAYRGELLIVAAGLGGVKVVRVD